METTLGLMRTGHMVRYWFNWPRLDMGKPVLNFLLRAVSFKVLGIGVWQGRLLSALFGMGTTVILYLAASRFWGQIGGCMAVGLYGVSRLAIHCDRTMKVDSQVVFFVVAACYFTLLAVEKPAWWRTLLAGIIGATAVVSKPTSAYVLPAIVLYLTVYQKSEQSGARGGRLKAAALVILGALIPMAIMGAYFIREKQTGEYRRHIHPQVRQLKEALSQKRSEHYEGLWLPEPRDVANFRHFVRRGLSVLGGTFYASPITFPGALALVWGCAHRRREYYLGLILLIAAFAELMLSQWTYMRYMLPFQAYLVFLTTGMLSYFYRHGKTATRIAAVGAVSLAMVHQLVFINRGTKVGLHKPLQPQTREMRAAEWLKHHIPRGDEIYAPANIGVLTGRRYYPLTYLYDYRLVYKQVHPEWLVTDSYVRGCVRRGALPDPETTLILSLEETIGEGHNRIEVHKIMGLERDDMRP